MADKRHCPVCKKRPPKGHVWQDFDKHVSACARAFYQRDKEQRSKTIDDVFAAVFGPGWLKR